jgi:HlyD family secretion protein
MQIDTSVAEADVGGVREGQAVSFTVDAYGDRIFKGKVRRVRPDSTVLQNVVTYDVVVDVDNPEEILLPGMTAFVSIVIKESQDTLKLPLAALKFRPVGNNVPKSGNTIYRLEDNQAQAIPVQIGIADGKYVELISGDIKVGDSVILEDLLVDKTKTQVSVKENFKVKPF